MGAAFLVPAALSALSAGAQYVNTKNAANRQDTAEVQALGDQQATRAQANSQVNQLTDAIAKNNPNTLAAKATGDYVNQLRTNAAGAAGNGASTNPNQTFAGSTSSLPGVTGASSRYNSGTAASQKEVQNYGDEYANEMGQIDAATRQRQNEALDMQTTAGNLNGLNIQSQGQQFVDQMRAQAAGQTNPYVSLAANVASGMAGQMSRNPTAYFGGGGDGTNIAADPSSLTFGLGDGMSKPFLTGGPINARGMFSGAPLPLGIQATNWD